MPPLSYRLVHWDAWLSRRDVETMCDWAQSAAVVAPGDRRSEAAGNP
jgi:hypothetical protein